VRGACWKLRDRLGRGTSLLNFTILHPNPTNKLVRIHSAPFWCWDKPRATLDSLDSPRPELGGSHHLPPYSIFFSSPSHLYPNGYFSRHSQSGVPKLSRFGLPGLWTLITPRPKLRSGRGLNQSCSSPPELSNDVSHFTCTHRNRVETIYTSRPFQRCFDPCNRTLSFRESRRTPKSHFQECEWRPHNSLKVGLRQYRPIWGLILTSKVLKKLWQKIHIWLTIYPSNKCDF
jgi:hypothetical protein